MTIHRPAFAHPKLSRRTAVQIGSVGLLGLGMAATIYESLGLSKTLAWKDSLDRLHHVYHGDPINGLKS